MKVKCINNKINNKKPVYDNITLNKEYVVLSIEFYNKEISLFSKSIGDYVLYRIIDDEKIVSLFPAKLFNIVSGKLSSYWIIYTDSDESYSILPSEWARPGFWEDFYNDEYSALEVFESVKNKIYAEEKHI
ncbi:MAG: hypothetical protein K0R54_6042 [Clostridiaceae bacterium]|jgi:hypothetical protein|nr:hypothetical protein [Clostridiaceae bacterium]